MHFNYARVALFLGELKCILILHLTLQNLCWTDMKKNFFTNAVVSSAACQVKGCDSTWTWWIFVTLFKLQDEFDKWQVSITSCNVK